MPVSPEALGTDPDVQTFTRDVQLNANGIDGTLEILLVEDNPADARLTREVFEGGRLSTHLNVVSDGEQALAFLRREGIYESAPRPKLVLLDLNLPRKDGREVLGELKHRSAQRADERLAEDELERTAASMGRMLETDGIKELLYANAEHPPLVGGIHSPPMKSRSEA